MVYRRRALLIMLSFFISTVVKADWAERILATLTMREKIGQLFCVGIRPDSYNKADVWARIRTIFSYKVDFEIAQSLVKDYAIGGVCFFEGTIEQRIQDINQLQEIAKVPLLIAQDGEWGLNMRHRDAIKFPRNMTLGAVQDTKLLYEFAKEVGMQYKMMGIHINFAPVVDINTNSLNPVINDRSFGENKYKVAHAGSVVMKGLQDVGIIACAKHFPGHGDTAVDSHTALPIIKHSKKQLYATELYPFNELINNGIAAIMIAHLAIPALEDSMLPSSLSPAIVTGLLKQELNFTGLVITDGLDMKAITNSYQPGEAELKAVLAGNDILLCPLDVPKAIDLIEQAIVQGEFSEQELNTRVLKILRAKAQVGLDNYVKKDHTTALEYCIRSDAFDLKRRLYQAAVTLVKSSNRVPLDLTAQCALVTIGNSGSEFSNYLKRFSVPMYDLAVQESREYYSTILDQLKDKDTILIALFGMNKFEQKSWGVSSGTLDFINMLKEQNKKIACVLFGSPYSLKIFNDLDALFVAYEDDPVVQQAAAEIVVGERLPLGKLPVSAGGFIEGHGLHVSSLC